MQSNYFINVCLHQYYVNTIFGEVQFSGFCFLNKILADGSNQCGSSDNSANMPHVCVSRWKIKNRNIREESTDHTHTLASFPSSLLPPSLCVIKTRSCKANKPSAGFDRFRSNMRPSPVVVSRPVIHTHTHMVIITETGNNTHTKKPLPNGLNKQITCTVDCINAPYRIVLFITLNCTAPSSVRWRKYDNIYGARKRCVAGPPSAVVVFTFSEIL